MDRHEIGVLKSRLVQLRYDLMAESRRIRQEWRVDDVPEPVDRSLANLATYLAFRQRDLRPLQRELMALGLSSLGRLENRVMPVLDAVIASLAQMAGEPAKHPTTTDFFAGEQRLDANAVRLFGERSSAREVAILVTCPSEAAREPEFMQHILKAGADAIRINCAHDDPAAWEAMIRHLRSAEATTGRHARVFMDLGGPKCRTTDINHPARSNRLAQGDILVLRPPGAPIDRDAFPFQTGVSLPEVLDRLEVGHRVLVDDGRYGGVVEAVDGRAVKVRISTHPAGGKLKAEKGLNFPDTDLGLSPLTSADYDALDFIAHHADVIDYSFVQSGDDVELLQQELAARRPDDWSTLAVVAKIETPKAVRNLPEIIARAVSRQPFGVMIARGDLAVEIGFGRVAEVQEQILWLCEAAHVPVIWATQVLENLVKKGLPARSEMTDAAMAARAECVMLNKGPFVTDGVRTLDELLQRMAGHIDKKTPQLRALHSWSRSNDA